MLKRIDNELLDTLVAKGQSSDRRRANANFHSNPSDPVQRLFISMEPDSYVRPHYHPESFKWEFFLLISGQLDFLLFDEGGVLQERIKLEANGPTKGLEIPSNQWHCTIANAPGTVFLEVKQGPYVVSGDKNFAPWSPPEGDETVPDYLKRLRALSVGQAASLV